MPDHAETSLAIDLVADLVALEQLVPEWRELYAADPAATPFRSPDWLMPWWQAFAPGDLAVLAARAGGRLVALAPWWREGERILPLGIGIGDWLDGLFRPGHEGAAASFLAEAACRWPEATPALHGLPDGSPFLAAPPPPGRRDERAVETVSPTLALGADAVPKIQQRNLRQARRRADELGPWRIVAADPATAPALLEALVRLHGRRWQAAGEAGVLAPEAVRRFHELSLPGLLASGLLRLYGVEAGGRLVAAYMGFVAGGRAFAYIGGWEPDLPRQSLGTLLIGEAIARAAAEGAREFDFLRGGEAYKYAWGAVDRPVWRRVLLPE